MSAASGQLDYQLYNSLQATPEKFIIAISGGLDSLVIFHREFSTLQQQVVKEQSHLRSETLALANAVAKDVALIGQNFLDVEDTTSSLHADLLSSILDTDMGPTFCSRLGPEEHLHVLCPPSSKSPRPQKPSLQATRHPTTTPITSALAHILPTRNPSSAMSVTESARSASDPNPLPEFIEHAYKFFVTNIFNPYPSREDKQAIVDKTDNTRVTLTSISNWFTNARRRCGWADILKRRCNGNREEMVDLAKRVFVKPDPLRPVDPRIVTELMEMKENIESMYERKTRTSAWIDDLEDLDELINPIPEEERLAAKKRETEEDRELRRREKEMLKEQREFERQKRKMQAEALRKADKVARRMQREEEQEKKRQSRPPPFAVPYPPRAFEDDDIIEADEPRLVAGGKRKLESDDGGVYNFSGVGNVSPALSRSSSFASDLSSDGRVPSLTWSDSGDERPYKRSRSSPTTTNSSRLSPTLEIPASIDYPFTFEPPTGLIDDPNAFDSIFDLSIAPSATLVAMPKTPTRGQKRQHAFEECEPTPRSKRAKPLVVLTEADPAPAPSTPLFTPAPSVSGTPTQLGRRRSSIKPLDLEAILNFDHENPQPVQITPPDASVPLEVGVFDWSAAGMDVFGAGEPVDSQIDFSQFLQTFSEQLPASSQVDVPDQGALDLRLDVPAFDLSTAEFLPQITSALPEGSTLDMSGLMSGLMSDEELNNIGLDLSGQVQSSTPDLSRASSVSPIWPSAPVTPQPGTSPTAADLAEKTLSKERKRREIEEKKAALEMERARLAELERELEDD